MKAIASSVSFGLTLALLADVSVAAAETEVVTKTTTYSGVVSEINPTASSIILKSETSPTPVTYIYTKETAFVDAAGNVVSYETIKNSPVRVEYSTDGGQTIVRRVVQTGPGVVVVPPAAPSVVVTPPAPPAPMFQQKTTTRTETETR